MRIRLYIYTLSTLLLIAACQVTKKVKDGDTAYQLKQYSVAVDMLEKEYEKAGSKDERLRKSLYLAKSYDYLQNHAASVEWYEKANKIDPKLQVRSDLAEAFKKNDQYEKAYEIYSKLYKETRELDWSQKAQFCRQAIIQLSEVKNYNITTFSANTAYNEYSPFYLDAEHIVFTSDREGSTGGDTYKWTGNSFSDIYVTNIHGRNVVNFDAILNSDANEGTPCLSIDRDEIYFTRCESLNLRDQHCRIYFSNRPNGFWMEPEPLMFFGEDTNFAHPCLLEQDSVLVFTAAPVNSDGTYDLYYSVRVEGGWSEAELMPSSINSLGDEKFPTAYQDTLFFSSDELPGYGGLDIFKTYLKPDGSWSIPQNVGVPINSGGDDFGLVVDPARPFPRDIVLQGYISSTRTHGNGDDIFFFTQYKEKPEDKPQEDITDEDVVSRDVYISVRVVEVQYENNDPNGRIIGKEPLNDVVLSVKYLDDNDQVTTDKNGRYTAQALSQASYTITATKDGYLTDAKTLSTRIPPLMKNDTTINLEIPLEKIRYDAEIVLESIYYDYNKWDIRKDAKPSLDTLKNLLLLNPSLNIELASHTDCRGEDDYNEYLSQKRAQSAVQYLEQSGITPNRLTARGYGELKPSINCNCDDCSEDQHQANRRTTFRILQR